MLAIKNVDLKILTASAMSDEEKNRVREYSKLILARNDLAKQMQNLDDTIQFIGKNKYEKLLWINQNGEVIPFFDISDEYLKNICGWHQKNSRKMSVPLQREYVARFGELPREAQEDNKYAPSKKRTSTTTLF